MDSEAEYDETNGWKRYIPSVEGEEEEDDIDVPTTNAFERKRRRR
jgi:hypothetical protein